MEASLLRYFIEHRNQNVSRKQILEEVWGLHEDTDTRAIDNFIVRLRRYIEDSPGTPKYLITVRGIGYRFLPETNNLNLRSADLPGISPAQPLQSAPILFFRARDGGVYDLAFAHSVSCV